MASTNHGYKHDQARQHDAHQGKSEDGYANPDPVVGNSGVYEDLDKPIVNSEQEYHSIINDIPKNEKQGRGYQNVAVAGNQGQTEGRKEERDYDLPESDAGKKQQGNYEELDKKGMDKDHDYQALAKGKRQLPPYQKY